MTTDRALDILAMSEQARWKDGIEPKDVNKAVETIRNKLSVDVLDKIRAEYEAIIGEHSIEDYDFCNGLIVARNIIDKYKAEQGVSNADSD